MQQYITQWLNAFDVPYAPFIASTTVIAIIFIVFLVVHGILHKILLPFLKRQTEKTNRRWPKTMLNKKLFNWGVLVIQGVLLQLEAEIFLPEDSPLYGALMLIATVWIMFFSLLILFSLLDIMIELSANNIIADQLPLRGIVQSVKLISAILVAIMIISVLIGKSPLVLITGLGAMTAVLMLVFKDPILGLVAGIQLSANHMLRMNDWLEMPKYGADGAVIDIGLTTVKVRNWDNTVTTIPTYALISDSFKNWRSMSESGGRRIKRSINIDISSIQFLDDISLENLARADLLAPYLAVRQEDVARWNEQLQCDLTTPLNGRRLTNIGTFRAWLLAWLKAHPRLRKDMTLMVRHLSPDSAGLPLEIYVFTNTTAWLEYEEIQSDIFDHIYAVLPEFGLRIHQIPTGNDMRQMALGM